MRKYAIHATASNPAGNQDVILSASRCGEAAGEQQFCSPESHVNPKYVSVHTVESDLDHRDSDFWITAISK